MMNLEELLNLRSHRELELMAHAHQLPFTRREAKATGLAKLSEALFDGRYQKAFQKLENEHIEVLQATCFEREWLVGGEKKDQHSCWSEFRLYSVR